MAEDPYGTEPMFEIPKKYRAPKRKEKWPKWVQYKGVRTSCDDCVLGLAHGHRSFLADAAAFVRIDANGKRYYCGTHTVSRRNIDELNRGGWDAALHESERDK